MWRAKVAVSHTEELESFARMVRRRSVSWLGEAAQ